MTPPVTLPPLHPIHHPPLCSRTHRARRGAAHVAPRRHGDGPVVVHHGVQRRVAQRGEDPVEALLEVAARHDASDGDVSPRALRWEAIRGKRKTNG